MDFGYDKKSNLGGHYAKRGVYLYFVKKVSSNIFDNYGNLDEAGKGFDEGFT